MHSRTLMLACLLAGVACQPGEELQPSLAPIAERFFRGVYGCDGSELSEVANPEVRMSYPIFAERLGTPTLEGLAAIEEFASSFCRRWSDPIIIVNEAIEDEDRVVLVWTYAASTEAPDSNAQLRVSWGGISVFHFDEAGRVLAEFGEESTPGPYARIQGTH